MKNAKTLELTYHKLFAFLVSIGFEDQSEENERGPHVFVHESSDTVLLYRRTSETLVAPADALSTEVHLNAKGLTDKPLESLVSGFLKG